MRSTLFLSVLFTIACDDMPVPGTADVDQMALTGRIGLSVTDLVPGAVVRFTVSDLNPGETTTIVRSTNVQPGNCYGLLGGQCLSIGPSIAFVGNAIADSEGVAILDANMPGNAALGIPVAFQAAAIRGLGGADSELSLGVAKVTGGVPCGNGVLDLGEICDDGNLADGDGCNAVCDLEGCQVPDLPIAERLHDFDGHHINGQGGVATLAGGDLMAAFPMEPGIDEYSGLALLDKADLSLVSSTGVGTIHDEDLSRIVANHAGGAYVTSTVYDGSWGSALINKVDEDGNLLWSTQIDPDISGNTIWEIVLSGAAVGADDTVGIVGTLVDRSNDEDWGFVAAVDANGTLRHASAWRAWSLKDSEYHGIAATADGGWLISGSNTEVINKSWIMKVDSSGGSVWWSEYDNGTDDFLLYDVVETSDGGAIVVGTHSSLGNDTDAYIARYDASGFETWARFLANPGENDNGVRVAQVPLTCESDPLDGDACTVAGEQCAAVNVAELCSCELNGTWYCAPGEPSFVMVSEYIDPGRVDHMMLTTFTSDGTLQAQTAWGATTEIYTVADVDVAPNAAITAVGYSFNGVHLVTTDAALDPGCDGTTTTLPAVAMSSVYGSITPTKWYDSNDFSAGPAGSWAYIPTPTNDDLRCSLNICPQR